MYLSLVQVPFLRFHWQLLDAWILDLLRPFFIWINQGINLILIYLPLLLWWSPRFLIPLDLPFVALMLVFRTATAVIRRFETPNLVLLLSDSHPPRNANSTPTCCFSCFTCNSCTLSLKIKKTCSRKADADFVHLSLLEECYSKLFHFVAHPQSSILSVR